MIYYKENGDKVNIKKGTSLGRSVYKIDDDKCIKIGIDPRNVSLNTLKLIRELDLKGIYKIYDILFDKDNNFTAYTCKMYQKEMIDLYLMPSEYIIENYLRLKKAIEELTNNKIFVVDLHDENVIVNSREMIIIDTDLYVISEYIKSNKLEEYNYKALRELFIKLFEVSYCRYHHIDRLLWKKDIGGLFKEEDDNEIVKTLTRCKYPIDYVYK